MKTATAMSGWECRMGCGDGNLALQNSMRHLRQPRTGAASKVWLTAMMARSCSARAVEPGDSLGIRPRHIHSQLLCSSSRPHGCSAMVMAFSGSELLTEVWCMYIREGQMYLRRQMASRAISSLLYSLI